MDKKELKLFLLDLIKTKPKSYYQYITDDIQKDIDKYVPSFLSNYKIATKIYWILHDISDFPKCKTCGKSMKIDVKNVFIGYSQSNFCSRSCQVKNKNTQDKMKKSCLEHYGVENISLSDIFKNKMKERKDEINEKRKESNIKKYNVAWYNNSKKALKTKLEKYGFRGETGLSNDEIENRLEEMENLFRNFSKLDRKTLNGKKVHK